MGNDRSSSSIGVPSDRRENDKVMPVTSGNKKGSQLIRTKPGNELASVGSAQPIIKSRIKMKALMIR